MTPELPEHTVTGPAPGGSPAHAARPLRADLRLLALLGAVAALLALGLAVAGQRSSSAPGTSTVPSAQTLIDNPPARPGGSTRHP